MSPDEFVQSSLAETFNPAEATVSIGGAWDDDSEYGTSGHRV